MNKSSFYSGIPSKSYTGFHHCLVGRQSAALQLLLLADFCVIRQLKWILFYMYVYSMAWDTHYRDEWEKKVASHLVVYFPPFPHGKSKQTDWPWSSLGAKDVVFNFYQLHCKHRVKCLVSNGLLWFGIRYNGQEAKNWN